MPNLNQMGDKNERSIVRFKKLKYIDNSTLNPKMYSGFYLTDLNFETDINYIRSNFIKNSSTDYLKIDDLLVGFCDFYSKIYKYDEYAIAIWHPDGPFINRKTYLQHILLNFPNDDD